MNDLHIVYGDSARGTLVKALGLNPAAIYREQDDLSFGRLMPLGDLDAWNAIRSEHWYVIHDDPRYDPFEPLYSRLLADADDLRRAEHVRLWLGTRVSEQLLLAWIVALFDHYCLDMAKIRVLDIPEMEFASGEQFAAPSISVLKPEQVAGIMTWDELDSRRRETLRTLWATVSSSSPNDVVRFRREAPPAPVDRVLDAFVGRYPHVGSGLGKWDERTLQASRDWGPKARRVIGNVMGSAFDDDDADWMGDAWYFWRLRVLADKRLPCRLLELNGDPRDPRTLTVEPSRAGIDVLEGRSNHIELNGIDEWIGGVHLNSQNGTVWFRRDGDDGPDLLEA